MSNDRIDGLTRVQREALIERMYGRTPLPPEAVMQRITEAIETQRGLSLVRAGDVMADLLTGHWWKIRIWDFIGVPKPPPPDFLTALKRAFWKADILGLTHREYRPRWLSTYVRRAGTPLPAVTDSFINDTLLADGYLHDLVRRYRVALVGRSAAEAAQKLAEQGLTAVLQVDLQAWNELPAVSQALRDSAGAWDLALIGAGESGRILAVDLAVDLNKVALDIGHAMDGIAYPHLWSSVNRRQIFRRMYQRGRKK